MSKNRPIWPHYFPTFQRFVQFGDGNFVEFFQFLNKKIFPLSLLFFSSTFSVNCTISTSVTKLLFFCTIWPFRAMKICPNLKIFAKVGWQFCQLLNSYSRYGLKLNKILPKLLNFAKSGHADFHTHLDFLYSKLVKF